MADNYGGAKPKSRKGTTVKHIEHDDANSKDLSHENPISHSPSPVYERRLSQHPAHRREIDSEKVYVRSNPSSEHTNSGNLYKRFFSPTQHSLKAKQGMNQYVENAASLVQPRLSSKMLSLERKKSHDYNPSEPNDRKRNVNKSDLVCNEKQNKRPARFENIIRCDKENLRRPYNQSSCEKDKGRSVENQSSHKHKECAINDRANPSVLDSVKPYSDTSKTSRDDKITEGHLSDQSISESELKTFSTYQNSDLFLNSTSPDQGKETVSANEFHWHLQPFCTESTSSSDVDLKLSELEEDKINDSDNQQCNDIGVIRKHRIWKRRSKRTKEESIWGKVDISSDDENYELVFDEFSGEVVCRKKPVFQSREVHSSKPIKVRARPAVHQQADSNCDHVGDKNKDSSCLTLKHALPYLPLKLRNRLTTGEGFWSADRSGGQVVAGSLSDHGDKTTDTTEPERYAAVAALHDQRGSGVQLSQDSDTLNTDTTQGIVSSQLNIHHSQIGVDEKKSNEKYKSHNQSDRNDFFDKLDRIFSRFRGGNGSGSSKCNNSSRSSKKCNTNEEDTLHWIDDHVETFEDSLEDPFRISHDDSDGLIEEIDEPLVQLSPLSGLHLDDYNDSDMMDQFTRNTQSIDALLNVCDEDTSLVSDRLQSEQETETNGEDSSRSEIFADLMRCVHQIVRGFESLDESVETSLDGFRIGLENTADNTERPRPVGVDFDLSKSSSDTDSDGCRDADDEFEASVGNQELDTSDLDLADGAVGHQGWFDGDHLPLSNDLLGLNEVGNDTDSDGFILDPEVNTLLHATLRQILEIESVIHERLALQPDLFNSPAMPAASLEVIDALSTLTLTSQAAEQQPTCPICLSQCEVGDHMTQLPCQHVFHPVCVRAWLLKSGTCPVCRHFVS